MIPSASVWVVCAVTLLRVSAQQPLVPRVQSTPPDTTRAAMTWTVTADGGTIPLPMGIAQGPSLHLQTTANALVARSTAQVSDSFTVRANFHPAGPALVTFGVTLGSPTSHTEFLVRSDGRWAIASHGSPPSWTPLAATLGQHTRLQVRVSSDEVRFVIDDAVIAVVPMAPGALDGVVGIYVGPAAEVRVSGVSVERTVSGRAQ